MIYCNKTYVNVVSLSLSKYLIVLCSPFHLLQEALYRFSSTFDTHELPASLSCALGLLLSKIKAIEHKVDLTTKMATKWLMGGEHVHCSHAGQRDVTPWRGRVGQ